MDRQEIQDWVDFCEGRKVFDRDHFSRIFMELYLEPLTEEDRNDLRTIFKYVPISSRVLEKMLRMDGRAEDKTDDEIIELVRRDLHEKRKLIKSQKVIDAIDLGVISLTLDEDHFDKVRNGDLNGQFYCALASLFSRVTPQCDEKTDALIEAFYGLANDMYLQLAMTCDLLQLDVNFDNYFELYQIGVDYVLSEDEVVVMNYRAAMSGDS